MKKKLTSRYIETVTAPGPKRLEVYDQALSGFGVRVSASGRKTWFCSIRVNGRMKRLKLGTFPSLSLADARDEAQEAMRSAQLGLVPIEKTPTLAEVVEDFVELYARPRNRGWRAQERDLKAKWKPLFDKQIDAITRPDVVRVLDQIVAGSSPGTANNALAVIKKLMNWALDRGMIVSNPISGLKPPRKPVSRERILTEFEIRALWAKADLEGYPFGKLAQMLLYTGQRRAEVSEMRWSEVDFASATWTIPAERAKNATTHNVPLAPEVMTFLQALPRFAGSDFVFTTTGTTPVSGFGKAKQRLDDAIGTSEWWLHDLRRTAASGMARIGVSPHVIEKILNHKTGIISGVAAIYNRYSYSEEKREALERWAMEISRLRSSDMNGKTRSEASSTTAPKANEFVTSRA